MDGLNRALHFKWRNKAAKYIFHVCESPPHGRMYNFSRNDKFPNGCPCNITIKMLAEIMNKKRICYKVMKLNDNKINQMIKVFKKEIRNFEVIEQCEAFNLPERINDVIVRDF